MVLEDAFASLRGFQGLVHARGRKSPVDVAVATSQQVPESSPQVSIEKGIDQGVDQRVGVAQPEQRPLQPQRHAAALTPTDEWPGGGHDEEGQPTEGEGPDNDAQSAGCFLLPLEDGNVLAVLAEEFGQGGTFLCRLVPLDAVWPAGTGLMLLTGPGEVHESMLLRAGFGCLINPVVHHQHDCHGDIEGHPGRIDGVAKVLADEADSFDSDVLGPAKQRRQGNGGRQEPNDEHHLGH